MPARKYFVPPSIAGMTSQKDYDEWLDEKTGELIELDKKRKRPYDVPGANHVYKEKIHNGVLANGLTDPFTGEAYRWDLTHKWKTTKGTGHSNIEREFFLLPTVDHIDPYSDELNLEICSWIANTCKSDQTPEEFITMCRDIIAYRGQNVTAVGNSSLYPSTLSPHPSRTILTYPQLYFLPAYLTGICIEAVYRKWLDLHAANLFRRDRKQQRPYALTSSKGAYKKLIHATVQAGGLSDPYTGEIMNWGRIGTWCSIALSGTHPNDVYNKEYRLLPTVDHVDPWADVLEFEICSWRINNCKAGLTPDEFIEVCRKVVEFKG